MAEGIPINAVPGQWFTDAGAVAASHKLYTYAAGTTTDQTTYSDVELTVANANPVVLDSAGRATVFLNPALGLYKFVLKTAADVTVWTRDNVSPEQPSLTPFIITGTAGQTMSLLSGHTFPIIVYLSDGSGGTTAGRWYIASSSNSYSSNEAPAVGFFAGDSVAAGASFAVQLAGRVTGLSGLTAGRVSAIGVLGQTGNTGSGKRPILFADSTTTGIILPVEAAGQTTGPLPSIDGNSLTGLTKTIDQFSTATGNVGAGEDVLYSSSGTNLFSANTSTNGDFVRGTFWGTCANNANAKTIRLRVKDDDTIAGPNDNLVLEASMTTGQATEWGLDFTLVRLTSTTFHSDASILDANTGAAGAVTQSVYNNTTGDTVVWNGIVGDAYVQITGEATADDDIQILGGVLMLCTQA